MNKVSLLTLLIGGALAVQYANGSPIDERRENIIKYSRLGDGQLVEGTKQLIDLYNKTKDKKVRDDLITLLVRQNRDAEALSISETYKLTDFSSNELEYLARAARNERQFSKSLAFYNQLNNLDTKNPNGLLGLALVSTDMAKFEQSKLYLSRYKHRFGTDEQYNQANAYFLDSSEPLITRFHRWNSELDTNPNDIELVKKLYRLAAQLNISPVQEQLIAKYPEVFTDNDKSWLLHDQAVRISKNSPNKQQLNTAYSMLDKVYIKVPEDNSLKQQSLQDMVVVGSKLKNDDSNRAKNSYELLTESNQPIPNYVKEAYADYLVASGSPFAALSLYKEVEQSHLAEGGEVPFTLGIKIVQALNDAAKYPEARDYLENNIGEPSLMVLDFTRSRKIENPDYGNYFSTKVSSLVAQGDLSSAMQLIDERLSVTPGDGWIMLTKAELEAARARTDDAADWVHKAQAFLPEDTAWAEVAQANLALSVNDWRTASRLVNTWTTEEKDNANWFMEQYDQAKSARLVASGGISHRTSPAGENESNQEYYLYSPKTDDGHDVYIHYLTTKSPDDGLPFEQQRVGAGVEANFYPFMVNAEAGKGIKLNDKAYFAATIQYQLNQHWQFSLNGGLNSANTPIKAIYQDTYAKDLGFSVNYKYSDRFEAGAGITAMKFDDENLRKNLSFWSNFNLFKHNRWNLNGSLYGSYERNKAIPGAYYYNPLKSRSLEDNFDLSYYQPFDHSITLTHHFKAGGGYYWQDSFASSKTWSVAYGQEWRLGKKLNISYDVGRKRSIYDGSPEFNNFINLTLSVSF
ncbi:poly-beta-1,6 N-acetyl-D-glucosamine export porin PgaA [[Mannheimia] succiniciproducens]|uniref:PgaA membrane beta barrel domain-containing protein n=1 Tax=Mannheimia succiniciproducens (strain KCTC 0769BP / MBEL55E) TaxID=221988 RepID=Q65TI9_MANSM|nr:poly-beta-1,6 N-acetyl-D-glucosamine export porin PgaA [[Mannheimia] succiniciproducens]AAU37721.1 unknown [[Mannheimia] succiniciproducens MBEL55E]